MAHVLLIHQAFVSPTEAGGTRHYELARYLTDLGHQLSIVASDLSYLTGQRTVQDKGIVVEQEINGIRVLRAFTYPSLHRSYFWRVISFVSFVITSLWAALKAGPVDVVMGTSPPMPQAVSAWLIAVIRRRPFLLEIRDLWPGFAIDMGVLTNPLIISLAHWLENFLYARAAHLMVNSPAYRDYLLEKNIAPSRISLIPNGVDPAMFDPHHPDQKIRETLGLYGKIVVTYAGALGFANDIYTILRAASHLQAADHIHFLLVGDGKERASLEAFAASLELENVTFAGTYPKNMMPDILAASDICLATLQNIPMFRMTYPNKVFDYMAAGKPTILAIDGVIREVIEAGQGGVFVPPGDDRALADSILDLSENEAGRIAMGESARKYVVDHFNRADQAAQFSDLIERLSTR